MTTVTPRPKAKKRKKTKKQTLAQQCDTLCGQIVRARGYCEASGADGVACKGSLQWCHGFGRGYHAVRWDIRNGFCMCSAHHLHFTHRPIQWEDFMRSHLGDALYDELRAKAISYERVDLKVMVLHLKIQASEAA